MHPSDADLWKRLNNYLRQTSFAWASISRQATPDQSQQPPPTPPGIDDHGNLKGLVPTLNPDGSIADYNDDHTQYPLIFGRPAGQYIYGSRPGTTVSWSPRGTFILAASTSGGSASWASIAVDALAPATTGIILVLSSHTANTLAGGETNYHTTITDTGGNTWQKLKEYSYLHDTTVTEHVSLWFCLVTSDLTPGSSTLTANFSTADHIRYAIESYAFTMAAGLTVTLVAYATSGATVSGPVAAPSLTVSGLSGETLFVRAIAGQMQSGSFGANFTQTGGFTPFTSVHTDSTNGGLGFGQHARGEFKVYTGAGATSSPFLPDIDDYKMAAVFGGVQIVSNSSPVTLTPQTGFTPITGGFITTIRTTDETTWSSIPIQTSAPSGRLVFLVLATHSNGSGSGGGLTNYHTGITDTQSNTWVKLKEFTTSFFAGTEEQTVSLWYCILTASLSAGADTLAATLAMSIAKKSIESYQFTMSPTATVSLSASITGGLQDSLPESLSLSAVANPAIYVRAMAVHQSPGDGPAAYTSDGGYTAFTTDHTNSTNTSSETTFRNTAARGEFRITSASSSSNQPVTSSALADTASVFCAMTLTSTAPPPNAYLLLGAANLSDASRIILTGRDIKFTAGLGAGDFIFDPLGQGGFTGTLDFDAISGSSKTYTFPNTTGTIALLSDITAALAAYLKLDASNDPLTGTLDTQLIEPSATATYDIGTAAKAYKDLYLTSDIIPTADGVMDIGTAALGIKQEHYAYPAVGTDTLRNLGRGMLWEDASLGDAFVGADNVFGSAGYYSQRVTKANSSVTAQTEDASNFYQGAWGSGASAIFPFIEMNYLVGAGAVGKYPFGADGVTYIRDGSVTIGRSDGASGGGGLLLCSRTAATSGVYMGFDEANKRFVIRTIGNASMAASQIQQIGFAGANLAICLPVTDATVDLGISLTNAWKNIFLNGYAELEAIAAPAALEGRTWNDSTQKDLAGYYDGITRYFEGTLFSQTADATVSNTTTETTLVGTGIGTATLPANFFVIGRTFRITARGYYGTQLTGAATLRIKGYLGATAVLDTTAKAMTANLANRYWEVDAIVTCRTTGATGTVYAQGRFTHDDALVNFDDWPMVNTGTTTIDTTASLAVALKVTWGAGVAAADTFTCTHLVIEALD